jgi:hypothetical protein
MKSANAGFEKSRPAPARAAEERKQRREVEHPDIGRAV